MAKFDSNKANEFVLEQLSNIILSKTGKNADEETKSKIQNLFGQNFIKILEPLQKKMKSQEIYKNKYKKKVN